MVMFVRVNFYWIILAVVLLASGCEDKHTGSSNTQERGGAMALAIPLAQRHSGYVPGLQQWSDFINCWQESVRRGHAERFRINPAEIDSSLLGVDVKQNLSENDTAAAIAKLERDLKVTLPQSYKDFLMAYKLKQLSPRKMPWGESTLGFFAPSQVGYFRDLQPEILKVLEENPIEAVDDDYFVYGTKQDYIFGRTRYLKNAILIGTYEDSIREILLYPDVKTADGEMEAAALYHAGQYRAPSFAELVRQLGMMDTEHSERAFPYSQKILKGTCSDKIVFNNVWWE